MATKSKSSRSKKSAAKPKDSKRNKKKAATAKGSSAVVSIGKLGRVE